MTSPDKALAEAAERVRARLSVDEGRYQHVAGILTDDVAALLAHYDASRWRPIAEAKKDGTQLLLARLDDREIGVVGNGSGGGTDEDGDPLSMEWSVWFTPTHFRPLPAPPQEEPK